MGFFRKYNKNAGALGKCKTPCAKMAVIV